MGFQSINSTSRGHVQSHFAALFFAVNDCWSIAAFQCCISFYSTAKWTSYTQIPVSTEPWAEVPEPQYVLPSYLFYTQHQQCLCIAQFIPSSRLTSTCVLCLRSCFIHLVLHLFRLHCLLRCAWAFLQLQQGGGCSLGEVHGRLTAVASCWVRL